jgi:small subunit ribosomal protein S21
METYMPSVILNLERQTPKDIDRALRTLRKKEDACGTLKALREKEGYEKPTTKRKRKAASAVARHRREQAKSALPDKQY